MSTTQSVYGFLKRLGHRLVDPLRADESIKHFTLAVPEAQTTTVDSVQGKAKRPPVVLRCPGCEGSVTQHRAINDIDCPHCWRDYRSEQMPELELIEMVCPRCDASMQHGRRHPQLFDEPEWATCPECQYHWDLDHWF